MCIFLKNNFIIKEKMHIVSSNLPNVQVVKNFVRFVKDTPRKRQVMICATCTNGLCLIYKIYLDFFLLKEVMKP